MASIKKFIKDNWLITFIVFSSALLRTWDLAGSGILFSDAARDLLTAKQAIESNRIPLVGIPSSIPRFHQGPLTIWLEMIIYSVFGQNTLAFSATFAFMGILAVIAVYEYSAVYLDKKTALVATSLMSFSPLAIAHSRVPYHTNPIPLVVMIFLFSLSRWWQNKKLGAFWAGLSWILVMQFELALFPLGLMMLFVIWSQKIKINVELISELCAAFLIGLIPQIIYDLNHSFAKSQIGGFILWVGYRIAALTGIVGNHQLSASKLSQTIDIYNQYWGRIFSTQSTFVSVIFLGLFLITIYFLIKKRRKTLAQPAKPGLKLPTVALILVTVGYFIHGSPSEAYFPPYLPLLSIFIGWGLTQLFNKKEQFLVMFLVGWALINTVSTFKHHFFVSNDQDFSYHASIGEQRAIIKTIDNISQGKYELLTTHPAGKFSSYFDNFRWLAGELKMPQDQKGGMAFYIEPKNSRLSGYPDITQLRFDTYDVFYR